MAILLAETIKSTSDGATPSEEAVTHQVVNAKNRTREEREKREELEGLGMRFRAFST